MTPEEFVEALRRAALVAAVDGMEAILERPPGRRPKPELVDASNWYRSLSEHDRRVMRQVMIMTAYQTVFGVLAVLDGARVIEDDPQKGEFRIIYKKGGKEWDLTEQNGSPLHELLNDEDVG
jgi:hypothetical protein